MLPTIPVSRTIKTLVFAAMITTIILLAPSGQADSPGESNSASPTSLPVVFLAEFASGLNKPVDVANSGMPGDERLFVVEKDGTIRIVSSDGTVGSTPFLNIDALVRSAEFERGLLGLVFDPDYASNGHFYVNYTYVGDADENPGDTRISRFTASDPWGDEAEPSSEIVFLKIPQPYANHNAGDLAFGPDGYLYIPVGDGGSGGDPENRAQNPGTLLGKILRIDVSTVTGSTGYSIPPSNPFISDPATLDEIWALGVRNPWRMSFDPLTGDLYFADVGQASYEEINVQSAASPGGENYGWRCYEGFHAFNLSGCGPAGNYQFPVVEYDHSEGRSVTGGFVYRGSVFPEMQGHYFFADYVEGRLWSMIETANGWQARSQGQYLGRSFSTFGEDIHGELYLADMGSDPGDGTVFHLQNLPVNLYLPVMRKP